MDFETVESLDGTFIANRYDRLHGDEDYSNVKNAGELREITEEDIEDVEQAKNDRTRMEGGSMNSKQRATRKEGNRKDRQRTELANFDEKIKSYISHNKGSSWELIRAPEVDMRGKPVSCYAEDGCSLHINMYSNNAERYAPPYSQESAIGIVMAIGSVGNHLTFGDKGTRKSTYLSRDGGLTWSEIAKIPLIYEFGDHGGLLVAAPNI